MDTVVVPYSLVFGKIKSAVIFSLLNIRKSDYSL